MSSDLTARAAIVLAAGQGTRMRSRVPKVLHPICGRPMIHHVLRALADAGISRPVVVTGFGADAVEAAIAGLATCVRQERQRGTADAVRVGLQAVAADASDVLVTMGDVPLFAADVFRGVLDARVASEAAVAVVSARVDDPTSYGRIVRGPGGAAAAIVEEKDADDATRATNEINTATYAFDAAWLRDAVGRVQPSASGELYLTDLVALAVADRRAVTVVEAPDAGDAMGINDRVALSVAEERMRRRISERHMRSGVTIVDPATTRIDSDVEIGQDARIEPWTTLEGATSIAEDAVVGPNSHLRSSVIGPRTTVWASIVEESRVAEDVQIGPFAHVRPGCDIGPRCRIGNFAEMKRTRVGAETQQHHFSYLGDAEVGDGVNVGAGSVTANFDGVTKHRTLIGDGASIGVDTMMVAPVTIGAGATTGAGAVVTRDVAPGKKVVGIPARPIELRRARSSHQAAAPEVDGESVRPRAERSS